MTSTNSKYEPISKPIEEYERTDYGVLAKEFGCFLRVDSYKNLKAVVCDSNPSVGRRSSRPVSKGNKTYGAGA